MTSLIPRSGLRDITWPALPDERGACMLALQFQYEQSERWSVPEIEAQQFRQVEELVAFCQKSIPFWRDRLRKAGLRAGQKLNRQVFSRLPILSRQEARDAGMALRPSTLPPGHGQMRPGAISDLSGFMRQAIDLRLALWHGLDMRETLAVVGPGEAGTPPSPRGQETRDWGEAYAAFQTGRAARLDSRLPAAQQLDWLEQLGASYLMTTADNAALLATSAQVTGRRLSGLRAIITSGESGGTEDRAVCRDAFGIGLIDALDVADIGTIAVQCPDHPHHHLMAEAALTEIVDGQGKPCAPGEPGRVIVTPLHNFAMPLLRCDTGLSAAIGAPCSCGRGLPVLHRIHAVAQHGRQQDSVVGPG